MKLQIFLSAALLGVGVVARPTTATFVKVTLEEPQNWIAGPSLFPSNVLAGYSGDFCDYTADTWAQFVLDKCKTFDACTSALAFSALNSGSPRTRGWFGYAFKGGATTQADYIRAEDVEKSVAYSVVKQ
ncbi:unnamed protein product [Clonostachys solani]|uniref:Uncharacterized protein n=1 Tax=Clonostachys solani TaxID=160281 RepID=A0A9N9ZN35_9HYPO|nr:unnamed protein product [Clonostachys solani]